METKQTDLAFKANALPCNPIRMQEIIKEEGTDATKTDQFKANLFILNCLAYGQLFCIDSLTEFQKLSNNIK